MSCGTRRRKQRMGRNRGGGQTRTGQVSNATPLPLTVWRERVWMPGRGNFIADSMGRESRGDYPEGDAIFLYKHRMILHHFFSPNSLSDPKSRLSGMLALQK